MKLIHYNRLPKGGHFAAWEQPEIFSEDLRAGFRPVAIENLVRDDGVRWLCYWKARFAFLLKLLLIARSRLKSRASLEAENPVLRQQVIVLSRKSRSRVRLRNIDRLIFVWLYRCFPSILNAITVVKPETVLYSPETRVDQGGQASSWRVVRARSGDRPQSCGPGLFSKKIQTVTFSRRRFASRVSSRKL